MILSQVLPIDPSSLTSIAAVMLATSVIVSALIKPYVSQVAAIKRIPIIAYSVAVALLLTIFADKVLHTLSGSIWSLLFQAFMSAVGAGGIYHLPAALQALEDTTTTPTPPTPPASGGSVKLAAMLLIGCSLFMSGCTNGTPPDATVQLTIAADSLAASETILVALDRSHAIPAKDRAAVALAVTVAENDLAAARANVNSGSEASLIAQVTADITTIATYRVKYSAQPATQPSK